MKRVILMYCHMFPDDIVLDKLSLCNHEGGDYGSILHTFNMA